MYRSGKDKLSGPKITILLPSYNVNKYIGECIQSVLNQEYNNLEIICIDAGSNDGTVDVLHQYEDKDSRIRIVEYPIKSYGAQLNYGIMLAKGEYIGIVETDDHIDSLMYSCLLRIIERYDLEYVKSDYYNVYDIEEQYFERYSKRFDKSKELYNKIVNFENNPEILYNDGSIWSGLYSKKFLIDNNIKFNESKGAAFQDIGFSVQCFCNSKRVMYVDQAFYRYIVHREGASSINSQVLKYTYMEWRRLLQVFMGKISIHKEYIYKRLLNDFTMQATMCLIKCKNNIDDDLFKPYYNWFKDLYLREFNEQNNADKETRMLMDDLVTYNNKLAEKSKRYEHMLIKIKNHHYKIYIFGCGIYGVKAVSLCKKNTDSEIVFLDNNENMWGKKIYGINVVKPDSINDNNGLYLIANKNDVDNIYMQLCEKNICKTNIFIYNPLFGEI